MDANTELVEPQIRTRAVGNLKKLLKTEQGLNGNQTALAS